MSRARDLANLGDGIATADLPDTVVTTSSPSLGRRNWLINSDFQVSQRGDYTSASSVTNGNYWVDRFVSLFSTVTSTYQHQYSQEINSDITANTIKVVATSSGTGFIGHQQSIENVNNQLGNKTITISVWVKSNNANTRLRGIFDGTGWTQYSGAVHTGDGTWQKLTATFTTGATRTGHYSLQFITYNGGSVSVSSGDYIEIAQPQVEVGSVATPFEHRSYGEELALCERYYQSWGGANAYEYLPLFGGAVSGTRIEGVMQYKRDMRTTPDISYSGNWQWLDGVSTFTFGNILKDSIALNSVRISDNALSGLTQYRFYLARANNDSTARFKLDAEL